MEIRSWARHKNDLIKYVVYYPLYQIATLFTISDAAV